MPLTAPVGNARIAPLIMERDRYKEAGVDIEAGNAVVEQLKPLVRSTLRPEVMADIGGFGGLFRVPRGRFDDLVLVASTDGVGTKLKIAQALGVHDTVGIDLVAMCVNDVVVQGAEPWFFLDYFATGRLEPSVTVEVVRGIAEGCRQAGCALIGGETAEMPSMYAAGEYDLAGFTVGAVERAAMLDGSRARPGMALLGLASSGLHSNGFSLVRHLLVDPAGSNLDAVPGELTRPLGQELLKPTRIYVRAALDLLGACDVAALAHITGGGLLENLPRVLPAGTTARIRRGSWREPGIFGLLRRVGDLGEREMLRTFNCGVGLVVVLPADQLDRAQQALEPHGIESFAIGELVADDDEQERVTLV